MKKIVFLLIIFNCIFLTAYPQKPGIYNDSNYLKINCYLEITIDQVNSGFINKFEQIKSKSTFGDSIIITELKTNGLPEELTVFNCLVQYSLFPKPFEYVFCYNEERRQFYKLKGFYNNDFIKFFDYLKTKGYKITTAYFKKQNVTVENISTECLINLYISKRNKLLTDLDRAIHDCLKYNMQPVTTY